MSLAQSKGRGAGGRTPRRQRASPESCSLATVVSCSATPTPTPTTTPTRGIGWRQNSTDKRALSTFY